MMSGWTDGAEEQLVRLIHARPALYDTTEKFYNHRATKAVLWRQIENRLGISTPDLKRRWESLRTQYGRYVRFVEPGNSGVVITGRQAWILNRLQFLEPHRKRKEAAPPANPEEASAAGSEAASEGAACIKTESPCSSPTDEWRLTERERKPFALVEESSLPEAEDTISGPLTEKEDAPPVNPEEAPAAGSEAVSDGAACIKKEAPSSPLCSATYCSTPTDEGSVTAERRRPFAAIMEESILSEAEDTTCRPPTEEPSPYASTDLSPKAKRRKTQLDEPSSDASTNILRIISKTLETLASRGDPNDDISAFCRNLDRKMRKLPPHVLPHFQHEVDTCLYRYQILTSYNQTGQMPGSP